ncbi:MAG: collagen binding domain-containing protein, partial [Chitinophagales bacterium]
SDKTKKGMMTFILLEEKYNYASTKKKNVSIEVSTGNMGATSTIHTGLKANGEISVGKERGVNFSIASQDILQPNTENTQYFIQYKSKKIQLESQNQIIKATYGNEENAFEKWSIGAIQDLKNGLTQLQYKQQKLLVDTRISGGLNFYNDSQNGVKVGIANLISDIPINNKGRLYLFLQDILISNNENETPYTTNSFQYFLRYESNPSLKWKTRLQSSYNSAHHPYGQQNVLQLKAQTAHQSLDKKHRIAISIGTNQKMPKAYNKGELLPPESYSRNLLSFNYNYLFLPQMSIEVGGLFEQLNAKRFSSLTETNLDYQTKTTEWSIGTAFKKYFWMNLKHKQYSIADFVSPGELYLYNNLPNFHTTDFRAQFQQNALSIGYQYHKADDYGRFLADTQAQNLATETHHALTLTYQSRRVRMGAKYYSTNGKTRLIIPLHFQGEWFKRSLRWKVSANAMHFFDSQTTTFFSRATLDWRFAKGWHLLCKGQLLQKKQIVNMEVPETIQTQNTKFELGLKKNFHFDPLSDKTYDLAIQCFRDENGNGIFDKGETSIPDIRLHLTPVKNPSFPNNNFKDAAIFSTAKNQSQFKNLPQGVYRLSVHQLFPDNDGYFNTTSESIRIDLTSGKTLQLAFGKGRVIKGKLTVKRDDNSSYESLPVKGIRITATNPTDRAFSALTDKKGNFTIFVPFSDYYIVETKNPYGEDFQLTQGSKKITFSDSEEIPLVEFLIEEAAIEIEWN